MAMNQSQPVHTLSRRDFVMGNLVAAAAIAGHRVPFARRREIRAYVGTYTEGTDSEGVYHCHFDTATGELRIEAVTRGIRNPSFLAFHPNGEALYAVEEVDDIGTTGSGGVVAYGFDRLTGALRERNRAESGGAHPAHISVCGRRGRVLVANYSGGTVATLDANGAGALVGAPRVVRHAWVGPARPGQEAPHPHSVYPMGDRVYVADLGLDRIVAYGWAGGDASLTPLPRASLSLRPGDGPRHIAFHSQSDVAYVINELSSTITALRVDRGTGALHPVGTVSTLPAGYEGMNSCADIHIHPNGRFVYGSNRGHDSIVVAEISGPTGTLNVLQHQPTGGSWPRNFALDPSGRFLLVGNQRSNDIVTMAIDPVTGRLSETGKVLQVPAPVCLLFVPTR
jgi:6-phosphogluconolactonase